MCNIENTFEGVSDIADQVVEENLEVLATEDTSQAMASPNTETLAAIEAADRGETIGPFETVEDLMDALNDGFDEQILAEELMLGEDEDVS